MSAISVGMRYYIGTSGWHYDWWRGRFYPEGLAKTGWLEYYAACFPTVELNNSFYRLPSEQAFNNWRESVPPSFRFAVKVSRLITHLKKLRRVDGALENFLARARLLGEKLGPLLYQLPPNIHRDNEVLKAFLSLLPEELHHVFEFRHQSWFDEAVFDLLRRHNIGFCVFDMPGLTTPLVTTADFGYIRFHGSTGLYASCYSDQELRDWASRIEKMAVGVEQVYIYFNNDAEGFAVQNAQNLSRLLAGNQQL